MKFFNYHRENKERRTRLTAEEAVLTGGQMRNFFLIFLSGKFLLRINLLVRNFCAKVAQYCAFPAHLLHHSTSLMAGSAYVLKIKKQGRTYQIQHKGKPRFDTAQDEKW